MRRVALGLALLAGLLGAGLLWLYKQRFEARVSGGRPISVVVATADLNLGDSLTPDNLGTRAIPEAYVEPRHIRSEQVDTVVGVRVRARIRAGETVLWSDLATASADARDLAGLVTPGMRAVAIPASDAVTFDGLLRPGDRVDVMLTVEDRQTRRVKTAPLLQNLIVLATGRHLGQATSDGDRKDRISTVTLAVWPEEATVLAEALQVGTLGLTLRNPEDIRILDAPAGGARVTGSN